MKVSQLLEAGGHAKGILEDGKVSWMILWNFRLFYQ